MIYKLRAMLQPFPSDNLVAQNEAFKKKLFEENSYPFGEDARSTSSISAILIRTSARLPSALWSGVCQGPHFVRGILLINGFPVAIGELKTPVRNAISWLDGAQDIAGYWKCQIRPCLILFSFTRSTIRFAASYC